MSATVLRQVRANGPKERCVLAFGDAWQLSTGCTAKQGDTVRVRRVSANVAEVLVWADNLLVVDGIAHRL